MATLEHSASGYSTPPSRVVASQYHDHDPQQALPSPMSMSSSPATTSTSSLTTPTTNGAPPLGSDKLKSPIIVRASSARDFAAALASEAAFLPQDAHAGERGSLTNGRWDHVRLSELGASVHALHAAVLRSDAERVQSLVTSGETPVDTPDEENGVTALQLAAGKGKTSIVELLLALGAATTLQSGKHGMSALHCAAKSGHVVACSVLLDADSSGINAFDATGCTALYWATRKGHVPVASLLLARGADTEATGADWRPLHTACSNDSIELVQLLLANGAHVNAAMAFGIMPLDFTASQGSIDVAHVLLDAGADVNNRDEKTATTPLHRAAIRGDCALVELLLDRNARVDAETRDGATPLFAAAEHGHLAVVKLLVRADPLWQTHLSPIHAAASNDHVDVLDYFVSDAGIDVDMQNAQGVTPLIAAVLRSHVRAVEFLVANGADVNYALKDDRSFTSLHFAAENSDADTVALLAESDGANVNVDVRDAFGYTPLHIAAVHGAVACVDTLLECGADLFLDGDDGLTVTDVAAASGQLRVLQLLVDRGFAHDLERVHPTDPSLTPLSLAAADGHVAVVKYLLEHQSRRQSITIPTTRVSIDRRESGDVGTSGSSRDVSDSVVDVLTSEQQLDAFARESRFDALISAIENDHLDVVACLCDVGAHFGLLASRDTTPLHTAAANGATLIAEFLLQEHHAQLTDCTSAGLTPLHVAATTGQTAIIKLLLAFGANVNDRVLVSCEADLLGMTPLHFAALFGHLDVLRVLLRHGANMDALTAQGAGVLECAKEGDNAHVTAHIIDFLMDHGAMEADASGATAGAVRTCCVGWF